MRNKKIGFTKGGGKTEYIKLINRLHIDKNKKQVLVDGVQYLSDKVDELNTKYNTNAYVLDVGVEKHPDDDEDDEDEDELNIDIQYISKPGYPTSVLQMSIRLTNRVPDIHINYINGVVQQITGNTIISIAKIFGCMIKAEELSLRDHSRLEAICPRNSISMIKLYILSTGISWYNSKGFVSEMFSMEQQHNSALLSVNIVDFLEYHCNSISRPALSCNDKINKFFDFFEKYNQQYPFLKDKGLILTKSMNVQEFFTRIKEYILRNMPTSRRPLHMMVCGHLNWLFSTIIPPRTSLSHETKPYDILYNEGLTYNLLNTLPLPQQNVLRIKSNKLPTTRKTTSARKRSKKSTTRRRRSIG